MAEETAQEQKEREELEQCISMSIRGLQILGFALLGFSTALIVNTVTQTKSIDWNNLTPTAALSMTALCFIAFYCCCLNRQDEKPNVPYESIINMLTYSGTFAPTLLLTNDFRENLPMFATLIGISILSLPIACVLASCGSKKCFDACAAKPEII